MTLRDRFTSYLQNELVVSPLTIKAYITDLQQFESYLDEIPLEDASDADVRSYVILMVERGDNTRSVNRRISSLRKFYDYLLRDGVIDKNPTSKIRSLRTSKYLPTFVPNDRMSSVVDFLLEPSDDFLCERDAVVILLLYFCGLRRAELASLKVDGFDRSERLLRVSGKGGKERIVPLNHTVFLRLEQYLHTYEEKILSNQEKCLILGNKYQPITESKIYEIVHRMLKAFGVQGVCSPHVLRHTFATALLNRGASIRSVQKLLGHQSIASTQIYTHNTIENIKNTYRSAHPRSLK